jgi:predicted O-linked N-acetylglucosamine transferase (SPINDLY family)
MSAVDVRITDAVADPEGAERCHSERLVRLPLGFLCYRPYRDAPEPAPPRRGAPVLGSFNNIAKVTPAVVAAWSRILDRVPEATILIKDRALADEQTKQRLRTLFAAEGIDLARVRLSGRIEDLRGHLGLYGEVDVALDPFPYNGTTTTCEAMWMGVPPVTLRGTRHAGRVGASLLTQVGLADLIAEDLEGYVATAAALAGDRDRLARLRSAMRARMAASSLCDKAGFARRMEEALRNMAEHLNVSC